MAWKPCRNANEAMQEWRRENARKAFNGTQRHKDTKDDDYDYDYDFLSFVLRLSFFVPIIFWSGFALEIEFKIKQIIVVASVNNNFKDNFKRSAQKKVMFIVKTLCLCVQFNKPALTSEAPRK